MAGSLGAESSIWPSRLAVVLELLLLTDATFMFYAAPAGWIADGISFWASMDVVMGCLLALYCVLTMRRSEPPTTRGVCFRSGRHRTLIRMAPTWLFMAWVLSVATRSAQFKWHCPNTDPLTVNVVRTSARAACLDGSPPVYSWREGRAQDQKRVIIFLQGGGWCWTQESCEDRAKSPLGSTRWDQSAEEGCTGYDGGSRGFLASSCPIPLRQLQPQFFDNCVLSSRIGRNEVFPWADWAVAHVRYCDGGSYVGNASSGSPRNGTGPLWYRGHANFEAIIDDLITNKGLALFDEVILSGCSAGGLGVIYKCDYLASRLVQVRKVRCVADAGLFLEADDWFRGMAQFMSAVLPVGCVAAMPANATLDCILMRNALLYLHTPTFAVNSMFDNVDTGWLDGSQPALIQHREKLLQVIAPLRKAPRHGAFIPACPSHCMLHGGRDGWFNVRADGNSLPRALARWYFSGVAVDIVDSTPDSCQAAALFSILYALFILRLALFVGALWLSVLLFWRQRESKSSRSLIGAHSTRQAQNVSDHTTDSDECVSK